MIILKFRMKINFWKKAVNAFFLIFLSVLFIASCKDKPNVSYDFEQYRKDADNITIGNNFFYRLGNQDSALFYYLLAKDSPDINYYNIGEIFYDKKMYKEASFYLNKALNKGLDGGVYKFDGFPLIDNALDKSKLRFDFDQDLICSLIVAKYYDQKCRGVDISKSHFYYRDKFDKCEDMLNIWNLSQSHVDSITMSVIEDFAKKEQWPTTKNMPNDVLIGILPSILLHQNKVANNRYMSYMYNLCGRGHLSYENIISVMQNRVIRFREEEDTNVIKYKEFEFEDYKIPEKTILRMAYHAVIQIVKDNGFQTEIIVKSNKDYNLLMEDMSLYPANITKKIIVTINTNIIGDINFKYDLFK